MACLPFICFAMLQGNRPGAMAHPLMGLRILLTSSSPSIYLEPDKGRLLFCDNSHFHFSNLNRLVDTYARLDYESTMVGEQIPVLTLASPCDNMGPSPEASNSFMEIVDARRALGILLKCCLPLARRATLSCCHRDGWRAIRRLDRSLLRSLLKYPSPIFCCSNNRVSSLSWNVDFLYYRTF